MPTSTWFRLNVAQRERVVNAAMREFGTHGFSTGSLSSIALEAEIPESVLLRYFNDKQELFAYVCDDVCRRVREEMERRVGGLDFDQPFEDWLVDVFCEWSEFIADHPLERGMTAAGTHELDTGVRGLVRETTNQHYLQIIEPMLQLWRDAGKIRADADSQVLTTLALMLFQHVALAPYYDGIDSVLGLYGRSVEEQRPVIRQLVAGLGPLFSVG
jgi:AcrR family transcriptional regulator